MGTAPVLDAGKLAERRRDLGLSRPQLEALTGIPRQHLSLYERRKVRRPAEGRVKVLAEALGLGRAAELWTEEAA